MTVLARAPTPTTPEPAVHALEITRTFDAPASLVFRLWSRPEHMVRWMGPGDFVCTRADLDFRPGGAWRACIESPTRGTRWMSGRYFEIEQDRRIVFTFAWGEEAACAKVGTPPGFETQVTVVLTERDGKTVQNFHQTPFPTVEARDNHIRGWTGSFDKQQAYVQTLDTGASA